jgi:hypothetical protein
VHKDNITRTGAIKDILVLDRIEKEKRVLRDFCNSMGTKLSGMTCVELRDFLLTKIEAKKTEHKPIDIIKHLMDDYHRLLAIAEKKGKKHCAVTGKVRCSTANARQTAANSLKDFVKSDTFDARKLTTNFVLSWMDWMKGDDPEFTTMCMKNVGVVSKALKELKFKHNDKDNNIIRITVDPFEKITEGRKIGAIDHRVKKSNQSIALDVKTIQKIIDLKTFDFKREEFGRDMFLLSFMLVGMNFADLYSCTDYSKGILTYNRQKVEDRRKDSGRIKIKVEPEVLHLIEKYKNLDPSKKEVFLFRNKHRNNEIFTTTINAGLKMFAGRIGISPEDVENFTGYSARRSWGTVSRNDAKTDKYDVHEALNHTDGDMKVSDLYIDKDFSHIWRANRNVLDLFDWTNLANYHKSKSGKSKNKSKKNSNFVL